MSVVLHIHAHKCVKLCVCVCVHLLNKLPREAWQRFSYDERRALIFGIKRYPQHMHNRLTRTHTHIRRRKSQCVCVSVCVFGYRTCHSVNRNLEMQADRARPSPSPRPRPRPNRNSSPKMRFYHASATIINDTRRVASCFILSRRVSSPAFFAKIANNGNYQRDRQTD